MSFRFRKIIKVAPGVKLNISKSGISTSFGGRGATLNVGKNGLRGTVGLPGTGLSYSKQLSSRTSNRPKQSSGSDSLPMPSGMIINESGKALFVNEVGDAYSPNQQNQLKKEYAEEVRRFLAEKASELNSTTEKIENIQEYFRTPSFFHVVPPVEEFPYPAPNSEDIFNEVKRRHGFSFFNQQAISQEADSIFQDDFREYHQNKKEWELLQSKMQHDYQSILILKERAASGDIPSMESLLEKILENIDAPIHFSGSFEVEYAGGVWLDIDLPEIEEIPDSITTVLKSGALSTRRKTVKKVKEDYSRLVSGIALILPAYIFELLPTVDSIVISGYTQRRNKATGYIEDDYIYSLLVNRSTFYSLNLQYIDPVDSFHNFQPIAALTNSLEWRSINPYYRTY